MASLGGVRVNVIEARGILAADAGGTSDPYVTINLLNSKGAVMAAGGTFKTAVIKKTLTPQWNESFIVGDKLDLRTVTTLRLLLRDSDGAFLSDNVLGVVDIPATYLLTELKGPLDNWFQLTKHEKMKKDSKGELHLVLERLEPEESLAGRGTGVNIDPGLEMKPAVSSEPPNLLYVTLKSGNNLLGMDNNGTTSDPIVFFTFNGQKHESTKKERTLKPQWNEKFGFFATDLKSKLTVLVEDYDITINDFMGKAEVSLKDVKPNVEKNINVELGGKKGKKDKQERGYLELKLLWIFDKNARDIASKRKKSNFLPTFGAPDQDYNSDDDEGMEIDEIVSKKSEEEMKKERAEKAEKQAALVSELSSFEIKSGDYNVQVHIIEARDLVPKDSTGTSDPVVYVEVFGEKQQTAVKKQVLSCFWDDLLIFPFRNLDKAEVEMGYVRLSVMDANTLQRAELIGAAQFDVSYIYSQANHQLANVWIGLTDITNTTNQGIQGYLRASVSIIGPGDKLVPPPSPFGEGASTDMNDVIMPPSVTQHVRFLGAIIHVAEHLPPMDVAVVGRGGLDAYVKGAIAGGDPIRTRVRTKKGRRDELCPSFNEELMLVIREPSMADSIQLAVYDWDQVGSDELVGYVYQSVKLVKAMSGKIGPFWANIYGAPLRLKTVGIGDSMKKQMNTYPDIASTYRGRLLLTLRILDNDGSLDETNQKRNIKRVPRDLYPREAIYRLRAHFVWGSQVPSFLSSKRPGQKAKMQLVMSCGLYEIASTRTRNVNGTVEWNNMVESDKMLLPEDLSQVPDIFLYLCRGEGDTRKAVCFRRYTAKELFEGRPSRDGDNGINGGFDNDLDWVSMKEDQALDSLEDETFPGNVLVRMGFGTEEMAMQTAWNRSDMDAVNKRVPYQLRVHIYQGRRLPPADSNGLLDPFLVVRCMGEEKLTSKKKKTRDPLWYETLHFDLNLPDLKYAPQVMLRVMDFDDFDTNDFVGLTALNLSEAHIRTSDEVSGEHQPALPDPKWHRILFQEPGDCEGEILASLELVRKQFPDETVRRAPSIVPRNRKAFLEITVLGLRNMEPYQFLPIQLPYIEFVLGGKDHAAQEMITEKSKRPSGSNPNFLQRIVKEIDLPENAHFAPRLNIIVKDTRLGGFQTPIVGSASIEMSTKIPWSKHYKPPQEDTLAEIELESADEWDDDAPLLGRKAKLDDSPSLQSVDNGAGVFGALKSMGVEFDPNGAFEEASSRRSTIAGEEDDPDAKKYLKHRELLDSDLESELKTTPFEKYGLHIGQKKKKSSLLAAFNPFAKKNRVVGDDVGMYKMAGYFKGLIRVIEREDEKPLLDFDTLLQTLPYEVRIYVLDGVGFAPMDIGLNGRPGKSDPYLRLKLGDKKISDRKNYVEDTTDPDFYKMFMFNAKLPGASILTIEAMDHDLIGGDDLIGQTTIDLEDRLFDRRWQAMGKMYETTSRLRLKPLETRTLNIPTSRAPMGTIKLWVDVLSPAQAHDYPAIDISLPPPVDMELRVVVWKARNVPSFDTLEDMNDLFFRCWMEGSDYQETDIHWRAKKGKGSFNWRMKFPLTLGHKQTNTKIPYFHIQGWDKDVLSANDAIGEHTLNLKPFFQRAYKTKTNVQVYEDDEETKKKKKKATSDDDAAVKKIKEATGLWDDDTPEDSKWLKLESLDHKTNTRQFMGEVCVSLELVSAENAKKNPVGQGRSSPNNSPYLPPPAGRLSFSLNPFKVLNDLLGPSICHRLTCCFCCILFMVLVYFLAPFINVAIITLKG
ncbi:Dysferlin [Phytophthora citrophthora]|uniref:Dysferlin n=1 Tax=Phytophthora citrophthora TaxID=4793 RepID=A0AAD9LQA5_9STRA|nr:Dysferlin [Phytophthora citrophthora]